MSPQATLLIQKLQAVVEYLTFGSLEFPENSQPIRDIREVIAGIKQLDKKGGDNV